MAAKLATVDEHILAHARGSGDIRDAAVASSGANERLRGRRDCNSTADTSHRSS